MQASILRAETTYGTFEVETTMPCTHVVAYCGEQGLPLATARRLRDREGFCYGWGTSLAEAQQLAARAAEEGKLNIVIAPVSFRRPLPHRRLRESAGIRYYTH